MGWQSNRPGQCILSENKCTIVRSEDGDRWVHLPVSGRVFYNYVDFDDKSDGWKEATVSWLAMGRHMLYVESEQENQPIPADLQEYINANPERKSNA